MDAGRGAAGSFVSQLAPSTIADSALEGQHPPSITPGATTYSVLRPETSETIRVKLQRRSG
jgi:hypothetical protein